MYRTTISALMLTSAMLVLPATAYAQDKMAEPPADAPSPDDASLQAVPDTEAAATDADAKMALLAAQLNGFAGADG